MTTNDRLSPHLSLTKAEMARVREIAGRDGMAVLAIALAAALDDDEVRLALIERMWTEE